MNAIVNAHKYQVSGIILCIKERLIFSCKKNITLIATAFVVMHFGPIKSRSPEESMTLGQRSTSALTVNLNRRHSVKQRLRADSVSQNADESCWENTLFCIQKPKSSWEALCKALCLTLQRVRQGLPHVAYAALRRGEKGWWQCALYATQFRGRVRCFVFWFLLSFLSPRPVCSSICTHRKLQNERQTWSEKIKIDVSSMWSE